MVRILLYKISSYVLTAFVSSPLHKYTERVFRHSSSHLAISLSFFPLFFLLRHTTQIALLSPLPPLAHAHIRRLGPASAAANIRESRREGPRASRRNLSRVAQHRVARRVVAERVEKEPLPPHPARGVSRVSVPLRHRQRTVLHQRGLAHRRLFATKESESRV